MPRGAAVVVGVLASGVLAAAVLVDGDEDTEPLSAPAASADAAVPEKPREVAESEPLELPDSGHPALWVRAGGRVPLYDRPDGRVIATLDDETQWGSPTALAVMRSRGDWAGVSTPLTANDELAWVRLDAERLGVTGLDWNLQIDLSDYRATLLRDGRAIRSFTVSIGAPGMDTPTGSFAVTDTFRGGLNPSYGCCAVALTARQPHVPSGWLGGDRIAIHGTSGQLGAAITHGCVRAADRDVSALVDRLPVGTPVTISQ